MTSSINFLNAFTNISHWLKRKISWLFTRTTQQKKPSSKNPTPSYLFIPFTEEEDNADLQILAMDWRWNTHVSKKPTIVKFNDSEDINYIDNVNCTVYVQAHGNGDPDHIYNEPSPDSESLCELPITEAANRLDKSLNKDFKGILKLYMCTDSEKSAYQRALNFCNALSKKRKTQGVRVDYYTASVSGRIGNEPKQAFSYQCNEKDELIEVSIDTARKFRKSIQL